MERCFITQSLVSAWQYMFDCHDSNRDAATESFLHTLNREKTERTQAIENGLLFESEVYRRMAGGGPCVRPEWAEGIQLVAERIQNAQIQVRLSQELTVCGITFLIGGVLDALKAGTIYDIKFSNRSFDDIELAGKYLESPQHPFYMRLVPEALEFQYLVSDGSGLYVETYPRSEIRSAEEVIEEFIISIRDAGYLPVYLEKWRITR